MPFKSQAERNSWAALLKTAVFDVLIALGIASLNSSPNAFWIIFALVLGIIWILPILFGWKGALYKYIFYRLEKRWRIDSLKREFRKAKLPLSDEWFNDASTYFSEVAENEHSPESARTFSAATIGQLVLMPVYSSVDTLLSHAALEAALSEYFDEIRRDKARYDLDDGADSNGLKGNDNGDN